jgi:hypothetical protein
MRDPAYVPRVKVLYTASAVVVAGGIALLVGLLLGLAMGLLTQSFGIGLLFGVVGTLFSLDVIFQGVYR